MAGSFAWPNVVAIQEHYMCKAHFDNLNHETIQSKVRNINCTNNYEEMTITTKLVE